MGVRGAKGCWREVRDFRVVSGLRRLNEGVGVQRSWENQPCPSPVRSPKESRVSHGGGGIWRLLHPYHHQEDCFLSVLWLLGVEASVVCS